MSDAAESPASSEPGARGPVEPPGDAADGAAAAADATATTRTPRRGRSLPLPGEEERRRRLVRRRPGAGDEPLRIMLLDPSGDAAGRSHDLANALAERGSEVHLFTGPAWERSAGRCGTRAYRARVEFQRRSWARVREAESSLGRAFWKALGVVGHLWTLLRLLPTTRRYDVVHLESRAAPLADLVWLWLVSRRRVVARTVRDLPESESGGGRRGRWGRTFRKAHFRSCDLIFAQTDGASRQLRSEYGVPADRIVRVRHGSAAHLRDVAERPPSCPIAHGGAPVILFLGPIRSRCGADLLLKAANHLRRSVWDFRVVMAGPTDPGGAGWGDVVRDLGLETMVEFRPGPVEMEELPSYLRQATVVVLPHHSEEGTRAAVSACTFGKPLVASRVGPLAELVEEADNGVLVEPGSARALAEALTRILRDDDLRRRYETNSLIYARTDLSWRRIGGDVAAAYGRALERAGRPAPAAAK